MVVSLNLHANWSFKKSEIISLFNTYSYLDYNQTFGMIHFCRHVKKMQAVQEAGMWDSAMK